MMKKILILGGLICTSIGSMTIYGGNSKIETFQFKLSPKKENDYAFTRWRVKENRTAMRCEVNYVKTAKTPVVLWAQGKSHMIGGTKNCAGGMYYKVVGTRHISMYNTVREDGCNWARIAAGADKKHRANKVEGVWSPDMR